MEEVLNKNESNLNNREYWRNKITGELPILNLPSGKLRPKIKTNNGHAFRGFLTKTETENLNNFVLNRDGILFTCLLAAWNILLYRYTNQTDIITGVNPNHKGNSNVDNQNLFFENIVLFRTELEPSDSFNSFYHRINETFLLDQAHLPYSIDQIKTDLNIGAGNGINPFFDILISFNESENKTNDFDPSLDTSEKVIDLGVKNAILDLEISFQEIENILSFDIIYNTDVYEADLIKRLVMHFRTLISCLIANPSININEINYISNDERELILNTFNKSEFDYPKNKTIVDLFTDQVKKTPDAIAVVFNDRTLTYNELNGLSNQLANYLISNHKIVVEDLVGIMLKRSELLIVSIMGVLKSGAAYVPIDPDYPELRINYIQNDSKCKVTLDNKLIEDFLVTKDNFSKNSPENLILKSKNLSYIIYTSGTTGNPKGVMIEHRSVVNLIYHQTKKLEITSNENIVLFSNYCFDASVEQVFMALLNGSILSIISKEELKNHLLLPFLEKNKITHLDITPSFLETLGDISHLKSLNRIIVGGEICSLKLAQKLGSIFEFYNHYGPTENTITSTTFKYSAESKNSSSLSIGKPISNTSAYILSDSLKLKAIGEIGELCLSGIGLSRGYLNLAERTSQQFIDNPYVENSKLYRTGDLARWLPNGDIEYIGRKDNQVKIRGHRIELGEIETVLNSLENIRHTHVIVNSYSKGESRIVAYVQSYEPIENFNSIKQKLQEILPDYLVPSLFVSVKDFPLTTNGKIDIKNLPLPEYIRPESSPILRNPRTKIEKEIVKIWREHLNIAVIGIDDNFFELGGTSILVQIVATIITKHIGQIVSATKIYQYPTIATLSQFLKENNNSITLPSFSKSKRDKSSGDVAIIGMAGRFPGAKSINELWHILKEGKETITFFKPDEIDSSLSESIRNDPLYVNARGIIPAANTFDAAFFGINTKLAEVMDPQQRLFLEIAWEVLEETGYLPKHYTGSIGVYAGTGDNSYYKNNILTNPEVIEQVGPIQAETVNEKDYSASRISYHLNLKGPAVSVHSACSTSLLAIAQAVESIRNGQCDIALAGGSSVTAPIFSGHLYQEGSMLSSDGHCRSFDAAGKGTVFSDGAGVVLLKSMDTAQKEGDTIYGIIKGVGINNDGGNKGSFTAPSTAGQAGAILTALHDAAISPDSITYIETHGTATPIGDPIEIEGLTLAFGEQSKNNYCAIGSIKSNMGHLTAAAGVAGLIKTILAMNNKLIPASLGFENPNPSIDFENSPFYVNATLRKWESEAPLRAGVSSFGVGGTNVHLIVEEYPMEQTISGSSRPLQLLMWSAKSENSLNGYKTALGNFIATTPNNLADVAYSLNKTRDNFTHRSFLTASNTIDATTELVSNDSLHIKNAILKVVPSEVVFLFPGQGSQFSQMGMHLYKNETVYKEAVDRCADFLVNELKLDLRTILYPEKVTPETEAKLKDTRYTQPALFVTEYALSQLWLSWGIQPTAFCGHSIGEFVAAHLAGVFTLNDVLHLITVRGRLVSELPSGSMLSVRLSEEKLIEILPESLSIAAINSNVLCVVAGEDEKINEFSKILDANEIANKLLFTSHAFHSAMMEPILDTFETEVKKIQLNKPNLPIISTVTGTWLKEDEAINPKYWTNHLRNTVRFADAAAVLVKLEDSLFLEIGPGHTLTTLVKQQGAGKIIPAFTSLSLPKTQENDYHNILNTLGSLWLNGLDPDWDAFYGQQARLKVNLPSYVFDRKHCWINPPIFKHQNVAQNTINSNKENKPMRKNTILYKIYSIVSDSSGIDYPNNASAESFLDLGLDSLTLTQLAINLKKHFKLPITFRQLSEEFSSPSLLADYLDQNLPQEEYNTIAPTQTISNSVATPVPMAYNSLPQAGNHNNSALGLIAQQLQLLGKQMELLQGNEIIQQNGTVQQSEPIVFTKNTSEELRTPEEIAEHQKPFGASPKIEKLANEMTVSQKEFLKNLIESYTKKTSGSKNYAQKYRSIMSDPRVVSGFKPLTKELVYPLVIEKSRGNRLSDIDGNEYIDALNGFGSCFFGHQPDFIKEALHIQVENGFEVGPQHPLAGEVCELLCEFTNQDRAALCNTGSEAVLGAMRIARTVTGRSLIVAFSGSYHGIFDEVLVRGSKKHVTFPAAPGILPEAVQNMLILDYGTEESLRIITERADEIAAVLVEPVQSRRPEFQPIAFLHQLRALTTQSEIALIFDEVITGFRMHPGGAQALFNIKADIATYGKVIGGGLSIGAITGKRRYLDALDGGHWQYGDDSIPEVGVTYFAGTFVRHPLALATSKASLLHLKKQGPALQERLNDMTNRLVSELNAEFKKKELPMIINHFGSLWKLKFNEDVLYGELLFTLLRENGIHIWDGFPCFLTEAYEEEDLAEIINTFKRCLEKMFSAGFFTNNNSEIVRLNQAEVNSSLIINEPPVPGAKLGRDKKGNPAWFVADSNKIGEFVKINL